MADEPTNLSCTPLNSSTLMFSWNLPSSGVFTVNGYHLNLQRTDNIRKENIPVCIAFYHQHLQYLCLKPFEISKRNWIVWSLVGSFSFGLPCRMWTPWAYTWRITRITTSGNTPRTPWPCTRTPPAATTLTSLCPVERTKMVRQQDVSLHSYTLWKRIYRDTLRFISSLS